MHVDPETQTMELELESESKSESELKLVKKVKIGVSKEVQTVRKSSRNIRQFASTTTSPAKEQNVMADAEGLEATLGKKTAAVMVVMEDTPAKRLRRCQGKDDDIDTGNDNGKGVNLCLEEEKEISPSILEKGAAPLPVPVPVPDSVRVPKVGDLFRTRYAIKDLFVTKKHALWFVGIVTVVQQTDGEDTYSLKVLYGDGKVTISKYPSRDVECIAAKPKKRNSSVYHVVEGDGEETAFAYDSQPKDLVLGDYVEGFHEDKAWRAGRIAFVEEGCKFVDIAYLDGCVSWILDLIGFLSCIAYTDISIYPSLPLFLHTVV
jgi:hypothetical protein